MDLTKQSKQFNAKLKTMLNNSLIKNGGHSFGDKNETVSSVIGKNVLTNTLSPMGQVVNYMLNLYEDKHAIKSIQR